MKALFLIFHGFGESNGISKKIHYQINAFQQCGIDIQSCYYEVDSSGNRKWMIDKNVLINFGEGILAKLKKRFYYKPIIDHILNADYDFIYIRYDHNANPFTISLINRIKKEGIKIVMEIPTFPYDKEYTGIRMKSELLIDKCFRRKFAKKLDAIVTFSNADNIFGKRTIKISNGIDFNSIPIKQKMNDTSKELHLLGVAEIHFWHGFDRIVKGLANYYSTNPNYKVYFHIVGEFTSERERNDILVPLHENNLDNYVYFYGKKHGKELDILFDKADIGIGSLARHRSGITYIKTLKNREYAARGIPFIYSEIDDDFEEMPYILKVPADETPIDIEQIVQFYKEEKWDTHTIRDSIKHLSWKNQMQKVIKEIFKTA